MTRAEGATASETLRQNGPFSAKTLESGSLPAEGIAISGIRTEEASL